MKSRILQLAVMAAFLLTIGIGTAFSQNAPQTKTEKKVEKTVAKKEMKHAKVEKKVAKKEMKHAKVEKKVAKKEVKHAKVEKKVAKKEVKKAEQK